MSLCLMLHFALHVLAFTNLCQQQIILELNRLYAEPLCHLQLQSQELFCLGNKAKSYAQLLLKKICDQTTPDLEL